MPRTGLTVRTGRAEDAPPVSIARLRDELLAELRDAGASRPYLSVTKETTRIVEALDEVDDSTDLILTPDL